MQKARARCYESLRAYIGYKGMVYHYAFTNFIRVEEFSKSSVLCV